MNEDLADAFRAVERYCRLNEITHNDNVDSVVQNLATVIKYQQEQITKLQETVSLLVAVNNERFTKPELVNDDGESEGLDQYYEQQYRDYTLAADNGYIEDW